MYLKASPKIALRVREKITAVRRVDQDISRVLLSLRGGSVMDLHLFGTFFTI